MTEEEYFKLMVLAIKMTMNDFDQDYVHKTTAKKLYQQALNGDI